MSLPDGSGGIKGDNSTIITAAGNSVNSAASLAVVSSGLGYRDGDIVVSGLQIVFDNYDPYQSQSKQNTKYPLLEVQNIYLNHYQYSLLVFLQFQVGNLLGTTVVEIQQLLIFLVQVQLVSL